MSNARSLLVLVLGYVLALAGCDSGPAPVDAFVPEIDGGPPASTLFGPCVDDSQCPGEGAFCRRPADGWPSGFCTLPCDDRTPCDQDGVYHHCVGAEIGAQRYCERRCLNGIDCRRSGYTCAGDLPPSGGQCVPVCSTDEECGAGTVCDRYTGQCAAPPVPTTGGTTGDPCAGPDDCLSGQCVLEVPANGVPSGWIHGYCVGNCILPRGYNGNNYFDGPMLPAGTCPGDALCLPAGTTESIGDLGRCYHQCTSRSDCREGYGCLQQFALQSGGTAMFPNGVCVPIACQPGQCPAGYDCVTVTGLDGQARNVCAQQ